MLPSKAKNFKRNPVKVSQDESSSGIVLEEDDPCKPKDDPCAKERKPADGSTRSISGVILSPGMDPRFQQQDQTLRCFVMYVDMNRCEQLLGEHEACMWFKMVTRQICPNSWVERWNEFKEEGRFPWHKDGKFPNKAPYGK